MTSAFEYLEIMQASFHYGTTKTVEQVAAEHEARHEEAERERKRRRPRAVGAGQRPPAQVGTKAPTKSEMDLLMAMRANAQQKPVPADITPVE